MLHLQGVIPPLATPLDEEGRVDVPSLHRLVEYLLDGGVHGLFPLGSTGEAGSLDANERATVVRTVVEAARGRVPIVVGVTDTALNRVCDYAHMARELGADGVVLAPMFYYWTNQAEILNLFRAVHQRISLPIIAYNIPSLVKVPIEAATLTQLAREGLICAVKDSSADISASREALMQLRAFPEIPMFTGLEFVVDLALLMGMHGSVPGLGNVAPRAYVDIYELTRAGRLDEARAIQEKAITLFKITRQGRNGQSHSDAALGGFKAALKRLGIISTSRMHAPWQGLGPAEEEAVAAIMQESGLF